MTGGFSFCGYDIADLGLEYAPENENTYVYSPTEAEVHTETFDGHHGGYFYGATKRPKEFVLRCVFEESQIDKGIMTKVFNLFKIGRTGKLVFSRRPWCYYYATVTNNPKPEFTNYLNGTVTITMQASYPFARGDLVPSAASETEANKKLHYFYNLPTDMYHEDIMLNTGYLETKEQVPLLNFNSLSQEKSLLLINPGTERAHVGIRIRGNVNQGVIISNATTRQQCKVVGISRSITSNANKDLIIDAISGKTYLSGQSGKQLAFMYHDAGFIELEPAFPVLRNLYVSYNTVENTTVSVLNILYENVVGKYIFIDHKWRKIVAQDDSTLTISGTDPITTANSERTIICTMNELVIHPESTMSIDIEFLYKPTFA